MTWQERAKQLKSEGKIYNDIVARLTAEYGRPFTYGKVRGYLRRNYNPVVDGVGDKGSTVMNSDGSITHDMLLTIYEGEKLTPGKILEHHSLDPEYWEIIDYTNNGWHSQIKGGKRLLMCQSKVRAKPGDKADFDAVTRALEGFKPRKYEVKEYKQGGLMAEVNIADLHYGKLSWAGDTGENYDHKIAAQRMRDIITDVVCELRGKDIDYILFVWTNDFFNSDTIDKTTNAGTPQDTDIRWTKLYTKGCELLVEAVDNLLEIAPVKTFYTPSNHDTMVSYYANHFLMGWYRECPSVEVDIGAYPRKYHLYGTNLIGFAHGHKENSKGTSEKASMLASLMPIECPDLWAKAKFREFHTAHLHSEHMFEEINGVTVRRVKSPTASDTWHVENGYVGASQAAQTFVYEKERGLKQIFYSRV